MIVLIKSDQTSRENYNTSVKSSKSRLGLTLETRHLTRDTKLDFYRVPPWRPELCLYLDFVTHFSRVFWYVCTDQVNALRCNSTQQGVSDANTISNFNLCTLPSYIVHAGPPPPSYTFFDLCPSSAPQRQLYTRQFVDFDMGHSVHTVDIGLAASGLLRDVMN